MHQGPPQVLGADFLPGRRAHQGGPGEEDGARAAHDHRLVAHGRDVGPSGGARAHHGRDLGDALGGEAGLVVEDAPEVLPVGEDLRLQGEEGPAGIHKVDAGEVVLQGHLLGPQVLLHRQGVVGAALDGGVVGHHQHRPPGDGADAGDDAPRRHLVLVHPPRCERRELQERGVRIEEAGDPLADEQLAPGLVALPGPRRAPFLGPAQALAEIVHQRLVVRGVGPEGLALRPGVGGDLGRRGAGRAPDGGGAGHGWPSRWMSGWPSDRTSGWTSASKERAMTWRLISLVPSPISLIFTWRQ